MTIKWTKQDVINAFQLAIDEPAPAPAMVGVNPQETLQKVLNAAKGGTSTPLSTSTATPKQPIMGGNNALR